jgi:lysozyme family protein
MSIALNAGLRREYQRLFETCRIPPKRMSGVEQAVDTLMANRSRYAEVADHQGVPWCFVALVHRMESTGDFSRHLHNGDPLTARTRRVPAGRPRSGSPPFTWEESAADAMAFKRLNDRTDWSLAGMLYQLEKYNGWGYRKYHPEVLSPYLWSFSEHYDRGKYVADGRWSDTAVSRQCGAAVLLRRMAENGQVDFADQVDRVVDTDTDPAVPAGESAPLVPALSMRRASQPAQVERAEDLQRWLNTYPGIFLRVDGIPGNRSSDAYRVVTGHYLPGDTRSS